MPKMTRSAADFVITTLKVARKQMPPYSHLKSPHKFTQPQLLAILALKDFMKQDYRGIIQTLKDWPKMRRLIGLKRLPHYSTLCYASRRLLKKKLRISQRRHAQPGPQAPHPQETLKAGSH